MFHTSMSYDRRADAACRQITATLAALKNQPVKGTRDTKPQHKVFSMHTTLRLDNRHIENPLEGSQTRGQERTSLRAAWIFSSSSFSLTLHTPTTFASFEPS